MYVTRCVVLKICSLAFDGFRNLCAGSIEPCDGMNVIYGKNAQGKTNLLESMWLFTGGRSFRGAKDAELVGFEQEKASLILRFYSEGREQEAEVSVVNGKRSAVLNGVPKKSPAQLVGTFRAVLFSPEHLSLIKGGPALRRTFIDAAMCQIKPAYASLLSHYNHTLNQRNALLKDIPRHAELLDTLEIWDDRLARYGEAVTKERAAYIEKIEPSAAEIYAGISENQEIFGIQYRKSAENLSEALRAARREDIQCGHTTVGPHRDDLEVTLNGVSARSFGSQGQQRSLVLALKLAEAGTLEKLGGEPPVVLLDDVMSELDAGRQNYLLNRLDGRQVFITCCEPETIARLEVGARFEVRKGEVYVSTPGTGYGGPG